MSYEVSDQKTWVSNLWTNRVRDIYKCWKKSTTGFGTDDDGSPGKGGKDEARELV